MTTVSESHHPGTGHPSPDEGDGHEPEHEHGIPTLIKVLILLSVAALSALAGFWGRA